MMLFICGVSLAFLCRLAAMRSLSRSEIEYILVVGFGRNWRYHFVFAFLFTGSLGWYIGTIEGQLWEAKEQIRQLTNDLAEAEKEAKKELSDKLAEAKEQIRHLTKQQDSLDEKLRQAEEERDELQRENVYLQKWLKVVSKDNGHGELMEMMLAQEAVIKAKTKKNKSLRRLLDEAKKTANANANQSSKSDNDTAGGMGNANANANASGKNESASSKTY